MPALQDDGAALAQIGELCLNASAQQTDQGRQDENAPERYGEGCKPERPTDIRVDIARIHRPHQRLPERLDEIEGLAARGRDTGKRKKCSGEHKNAQACRAEPTNQSDRTCRHGLVERVPEPGYERNVLPVHDRYGAPRGKRVATASYLTGGAMRAETVFIRAKRVCRKQ